jgi:hypothetical protein
MRRKYLRWPMGKPVWGILAFGDIGIAETSAAEGEA